MAKDLYRSSQELHLKDPTKDQLDRASLSIVLNLAEGSAKETLKDRKRFYVIALGSLREAQAIFELLGDRALDQSHVADTLGASLYRLIRNPGSGP